MTQYDYAERVYAGVLGKIIGVYLGRPFEGASYEDLAKQFGEVDYYVHDRLGKPLIVTDDDISGTFTFLRALPDNGNNPDITPEDIGNSWLNYIVANRSILWWGGMGISTEQTAYLRLKNGVKAPQSGSIALNTQVVAEQIGAQIFIDGWGLICPGDPERAVDFARRAASVSHDGEAIHGAQVVAAMVAAAFVEKNIDRLLDTAVGLIPQDSLIARLIADIREWHAETPDDWRASRVKIAEWYGYQRYGGGCHMVPNHALIIHALLHGGGDFSRSLMIVNTCGWDTDCNSANVGCILGVRNGLQGLEGDKDWRGPVADRMFLPTADSGRCVTDAVQESIRIANIGLSLAGKPPVIIKGNVRFSFAFPGSVQGFSSEDTQVVNSVLPYPNERGLKIPLCRANIEEPLRVQTPTFLSATEITQEGYGVMGSPTLYPGQVIEADVILAGVSSGRVTIRLFVAHSVHDGEVARLYAPAQHLQPGRVHKMRWVAPSTKRQPIVGVGIEVIEAQDSSADLYLDSLTWSGAPKCELHRPEQGSTWRQAWMNGVSEIQTPGWTSGLRLVQNEGTGLVSQGTEDWSDYTVSARVNAHLCDRFGIAARVQGLRRYYALLLTRKGSAQLVKVLNEESVVAETPYEWQFDEGYDLSLTVSGNTIHASINGRSLLEFIDNDTPLKGGAIGIVCTDGNILVETVRVG